MDLPKADECYPHDLLRIKLKAYGLDITSLQRNYLSNRKQRTKIGFSFSDWLDVIFGIL